MWQAWERQLKQCYTAEKRRHSGNLEALQKELSEALLQQDSARKAVRQIAGGQDALPMEVCSMEEDLQFEELIASEQSPAEEDMDEEVLQRALQMANRSSPVTPPVTRTHPRTPHQTQQRGVSGVEASLRNSSRLQPFPPPKPLQNLTHHPAADLNPLPSPAAREDPYQDGVLPSSQSSMPQTTSGGKAKIKHQSRAPVKEGAKPTGPVGKKVLLHSPSKLEELRANATQAVMHNNEPLDKGGTLRTPGGHESSLVTGTQHMMIFDDDGPDEPGTGGLEATQEMD